MPPEAGPLSEEEKELARKNHIAFITKIYILNVTFLGLSNVQWYILTENKTIQSMINKNSQLGMFVGFFTYLGMLCQIHFGPEILNNTCMLWIYTITMAELGSVSIAMACSDANLANLFCALVCSMILLTICILLSKSITTQPFRDMDYLTLWTVRFFIIALMGIIVSKSCGDEYVEAFLMMFTASFMTMFVFAFARSLSATCFFEENQSKTIFLALMFYYNFACVWSGIVMSFLAEKKGVQDDEIED